MYSIGLHETILGYAFLECWDRSIGTIEITDFLDFLDDTGAKNLRLAENLRGAMKEKPGWIPGFNDIIPLTGPKMSSSASLLCNIPMPNTYSSGLLRTYEGLQVFCQRLRGYVADERQNASAQLRQVLAWVGKLEAYDQWNAKESAWACAPLAEWISPEKTYNDAREYRCEIHRLLNDAEAFLVSINEDPRGSICTDRKEQKNGFCYDTLLVERIRMAITTYGRATMKQNNWPTEWPSPKIRNWLSASMNDYWDELPEVSRKVATYTGCDAGRVVDA